MKNLLWLKLNTYMIQNSQDNKIIKQINLQKDILNILKEGNLENLIDTKFKSEDKYFPTCLISYERAYYVSDYCRLTIDDNIKYFDINNNKLNTKFIKDNIVIVELKINEEDFESFFQSNFNFGSLINVRMSKYMRARSFFLNFEYF